MVEDEEQQKRNKANIPISKVSQLILEYIISITLTTVISWHDLLFQKNKILPAVIIELKGPELECPNPEIILEKRSQENNLRVFFLLRS